jgi:hypothetical protein
MGVEPVAFWDYTMAEALSIVKRQEMADRLFWNHTASVLSLLANVNSSKSKKYKPGDFHPYEISDKKGEFKSREEVMDFVKTFNVSNGTKRDN